MGFFYPKKEQIRMPKVNYTNFSKSIPCKSNTILSAWQRFLPRKVEISLNMNDPISFPLKFLRCNPQ